MAEKEQEIKTEEQGSQESSKATAESKKSDSEMIPKGSYDVVAEKYNRTKDELQATQKALKEAEEKRLEEQEQWRELAQKRQEEIAALQPKAAVAEEQEKSLSAYLKAQVEEIPEDMRSLIPEQLTTLQKLDWLAANRSKLLKPIGPDIGAGQRGAGGGSGSSAEITETMRKGAQVFGLTDEQLKRAAKRNAEKENK